MCHAHNAKWETETTKGKRTDKSRKNQNLWREGKLQVLGNIGSEHNQTIWNEKKKIARENLRRIKKLLETNLCCRNLIKGVNIKAVLLVRFSGPFLTGTEEKLIQMDQKTKKLMTKHKAL